MSKTTLEIEMPDGSVWGVPVSVIARSRAEHYAKEFDGDVEKSLAEDTLPMFASEDGDYEIKDWASGNMNWSDVEKHATRLRGPKPMTDDDMQEAWVNGERKVV